MEDNTPIQDWINLLLEGTPSLADLRAMQQATTQGLPPKRLAAVLETMGTFAPLEGRGLSQKRLTAVLESQGAFSALDSRGLPARRPRVALDVPGSLADLLAQQNERTKQLRPSAISRLHRAEIAFNGAMILDEDPLKIGVHNFADLQNFRYTNSSPEGINGYTKITSVALAALIRNGHQLVKTIASVPTSYVLVQASGSVYANAAIVPAAGNFGSALWVDSAGAGLGRFATWPDGTGAYANGVDSVIWGTTEHRIAAFVNYDDPLAAFSYDYTERVANTTATASQIATLIRDASSDIWLLIGATRPIQGIKFTIGTANTGASTSTVEYWNGSAWAAVSGFSDGTASGGATLAQTGTMSFSSTVTTARVRYLNQQILYFYRVKVGATGTPDAGITVTYATVDTPMQPVVDIWDGVERVAQSVFFPNQGDFTFDVLDASFAQAPVGIPIGGIIFALQVVFPERMSSIKIRMIPDAVNTTAQVMEVWYWNGTALVSVGALTDTTSFAGASLGQSGTLSWNPPPATSEFPVMNKPFANNDTFGFTYYLVFTSGGAANNTDPNDPESVIIDQITGIPAQRWNATSPVLGYRFPFQFAGRSMLAGLKSTGEAHRIDYSATGQPDVWNGTQSSDLGQQIYVGDQEALTCAVELSNRYGGVLTAFAVVLKASESWVLQGNTPETFVLYRINDVVGCPAPLSLATAELTPTAAEPIARTIAMWCSTKGPVYFDGSVIVPMRFPHDGFHSSVDAYFNPADTRCINTAQWELVSGWYDAQHSEYNLLIPSGAGQTTNNAWLVCDLLRRKWYRKVPVTFPQVGWQVQDTLGTPYLYAGMASGHMTRLEFGTTWDGTDITHVLITADMLMEVDGRPGSPWDETLLRYVKFLAKVEPASGLSIVCSHAPNGTGTFTTYDTLTLNGSGRFNRTTSPVNFRSFSHQFQFSCVTNANNRAPRLLGLAALFRIERQLLLDVT